MASTPTFKLDIGCVERDEDKTDFLLACSRLDLRTIRSLIEYKGVEVDSTDSIGQTGLHFVVGSVERDSERQSQIIKYLVKQGADVNKCRTTDGWSPVFIAVIFGRGPIVSTLLQLGAKPRIRDFSDLTPEDYADKYRQKHVKDLLIHSRSKVPHSRFSCVQQGPALTVKQDTAMPDDAAEVLLKAQ